MAAMTLNDAVRHVTTTNPLFAVHDVDIRGVTFRAFRNIPGTTRALMEESLAAHTEMGGTYLCYRDQTWTYQEFCNDVNRLAHALRDEYGVAKGVRVAIAMRNCPDLLIVMMAVMSIGGVAVLLNAWWTTEELDYALRDSEARLVFADGLRLERLLPIAGALDVRCIAVQEPAPEGIEDIAGVISRSDNISFPTQVIDTDDDMAVMYSSGTSGHPKGVVLTHRGAMNAVYTSLMLAEIAPLIEPQASDAPPPLRHCFLVVTPLFHVTATHPVFLVSHPAAARLIIMDKWVAKDAVRLIEQEKVTRFIGVPTQSADLQQAAIQMNAPLKSLSFLGAGGAKRPAAQVGALAAHFPHANIATGWGMTETNANGIGLSGPEYLANPGAAGRLHPPVQELKIVDENGQETAPGDIGEITIKSPCNMRLYLNKPEATAATLREGWLHTGDLGWVTEDGLVTIVDRKKSIVIRGGENISCLDVEGALHRHPAVAEACAFAVPHERLGEVVGVGIQLRADQKVSSDALRAFLAEHIAHFKIPDHFWFFQTPLPRGATDKFDRRGLREQCLQSLKKELTSS